MAVELIDSMGDDLRIVNFARTSFHRESKVLTEADKGLIRFLMRNKHATPFESVVFTFKVRTPIAVAREWMRHRIASYNEESTRYVEKRPDFYIPPPKNVRTQIGKPGHYEYVRFDDNGAMKVIAEFNLQFAHAYASYERLLKLGVARELARNVLPLGLLTEFVTVINLRSLFNFLSLRTAPNALLEIREEAQQVEALIEPLVPTAMAAWREFGRMAI